MKWHLAVRLAEEVLYKYYTNATTNVTIISILLIILKFILQMVCVVAAYLPVERVCTALSREALCVLHSLESACLDSTVHTRSLERHSLDCAVHTRSLERHSVPL